MKERENGHSSAGERGVGRAEGHSFHKPRSPTAAAAPTCPARHCVPKKEGAGCYPSGRAWGQAIPGTPVVTLQMCLQPPAQAGSLL